MATEIEDDLWRTTFVHFMKVTNDCEQAKQHAAVALGAYRDRHTPPSPPDTSRATPDFQVKNGVATFTVDASAISTNAETFTFSPVPPSPPDDPTFSSEQKIVGEEGGSLGILTASYHPGHVFVTVIDEDAQESIVIVSLAGLRALVGHEPAIDQPEPVDSGYPNTITGKVTFSDLGEAISSMYPAADVVWARTARVSHTGGVAPWTFGSRVCEDNDNLVACLALLSREGFAYGDQDEVKIFRLAQSDRDIEGEYGIITLTHDSEGRVDGVLSGDEWTELEAQVSARSADDGER